MNRLISTILVSIGLCFAIGYSFGEAPNKIQGKIITGNAVEGIVINYFQNNNVIASGKWTLDPMLFIIDGHLPNGIINVSGNIDNKEINIKQYIEDDKVTGAFEMYSNGVLRMSCFFDKNYASGYMRWYSSEDGILKKEVSLVKGVLHGTTKKYENHMGEIITWEYQYVNGKKEGLSKAYYADGALFQEGNYANDKRDGLWKKYSKTEKISEENYYKEDKMIRLIKYNEAGVILSDNSFE